MLCEHLGRDAWSHTVWNVVLPVLVFSFWVAIGIHSRIHLLVRSDLRSIPGKFSLIFSTFLTGLV